MSKQTPQPSTEYFGQLPNVDMGSGLKTIRISMTPDEAECLGKMLLAASAHADRAIVRPRRTYRSNLKPINQVILTGHVRRKQITVLGRESRKSARKISAKTQATSVAWDGGDN